MIKSLVLVGLGYVCVFTGLLICGLYVTTIRGIALSDRLQDILMWLAMIAWLVMLVIVVGLIWMDLNP